MKLTLERDVFLAQLQTVTRVASTRSAVQALSGVKLVAGATAGCELRATDTEVGLRVPLAAQVERAGRSSCRRLFLVDSCARSRHPVTLELRAAEQDLEIVSGDGRSTCGRCAARTSRHARARWQRA